MVDGLPPSVLPVPLSKLSSPGTALLALPWGGISRTAPGLSLAAGADVWLLCPWGLLPHPGWTGGLPLWEG